MKNNLENMSGVRDAISQSLGLTLTDDKMAKVMEGKSLSLDELLKHHTLTELGVALIRLDSLSKTVADVEKSPDVQKARLVSDIGEKIVLRLGKGEGEMRFIVDENYRLASLSRTINAGDKDPNVSVVKDVSGVKEAETEFENTEKIVLRLLDENKSFTYYKKEVQNTTNKQIKRSQITPQLVADAEAAGGITLCIISKDVCFVVDSGMSSGSSIMRSPTP